MKVVIVMVLVCITVLVIVTHLTDRMWNNRCKNQYGQIAVKAPYNGQCIIEDGTIRYLR